MDGYVTIFTAGKRIMDQPAKPFPFDGPDTRRWIGRLIIAVLLGEALWGLIVSVMNNVVVPWLGDVMGQSSGLPTSFTQRPYNYPDLFVSVFEFCIAGLVAATLNYFLQGPAARKIRTVPSPVPVTPVKLLQTIPQPPQPAAPIQTQSPVAPPAPVAKPEPINVAAPVRVAPPQPVPPVASAPIARPVAVAPPAPTPASPVAVKPPAPKAEPAKPTKPKEVYYNIVGEPMPSDDD